MTVRDGKAIARENEVSILRSLHRFGWLRTRDLATLIWRTWGRNGDGVPNMKPLEPTASELRMAQRTLKRMRGKRLILSSMAPDGSNIHALSEAGVRVLQNLGIPAASGKDLIRGSSTAYYQHRSVANQVAISAIVAGCRVSTEREIARGNWLGGESGVENKRPDVLIRSGNVAYWVEIEKSRKNAKDYANLLLWLRKVRDDIARPTGDVLLGGTLRWGKVIFVCVAAFERRLKADLVAAGWNTRQIDQCIRCETALYRFEATLFSS